jgi:hypothetical protein
MAAAVFFFRAADFMKWTSRVSRPGQGGPQPDGVGCNYGLDRGDVDKGLRGGQPGPLGIDQGQHGREHFRRLAIHGGVGAVEVHDIRIPVDKCADAVFAAIRQRESDKTH